MTFKAVQRDMSTTLFPEWRPRTYPAWVEKCGKEKLFFKRGIALSARHIEQAEDDGLEQIAPLIALFRERPSAVRKRVGKGAWKRIHSASLTTNVRRARLYLRGANGSSWEEITRIRPCHLSSVLANGLLPYSLYSGTHAGAKNFNDVQRVYRDVVRMGGEPVLTWSLEKLEAAHDKLARESAMKAFDPTHWADECAVEIDGFRFTRLVSSLHLQMEAVKQKNCIASYEHDAKTGEVLVFKIEGEERATFAFSRPGKRFRYGGTYFEVKQSCNAAATKACRAACEILHEMWSREGMR